MFRRKKNRYNRKKRSVSGYRKRRTRRTVKYLHRKRKVARRKRRR